jgi:hypothetical protein
MRNSNNPMAIKQPCPKWARDPKESIREKEKESIEIADRYMNRRSTPTTVNAN